MLSGAPIMAFVATTSPDAARGFYADVLGLRLTSQDSFALTFDAAGTTLRIAKVERLVPAEYTVLGWVVSNIQSVVDGLSRRGVQFERFSFMQQDDRGIWSAPSGAMVAWFKDPDGNTLSITQLG